MLNVHKNQTPKEKNHNILVEKYENILNMQKIHTKYMFTS